MPTISTPAVSSGSVSGGKPSIGLSEPSSRTIGG